MAYWLGNRDLTIRQRQRRRLLSKRITAHTFYPTLALSSERQWMSFAALWKREVCVSKERENRSIAAQWPRNRGNVIFELYFTFLFVSNWNLGCIVEWFRNIFDDHTWLNFTFNWDTLNGKATRPEVNISLIYLYRSTALFSAKIRIHSQLFLFSFNFLFSSVVKLVCCFDRELPFTNKQLK